MRPSIKAPSWVYSSVFNIPACAISPSILWLERGADLLMLETRFTI